MGEQQHLLMQRSVNMKAITDNFAPEKFETKGIVQIGGKEVPYQIISEDNLVSDKEGHPVGSIFTFTYLGEGNDSSRPVLFAFNGGPGSASVWLHLGLLGPHRVVLDREGIAPPTCPPYLIEDNPFCILDTCDVVLMDPVGTGFGVLIEQEAAEEMYSVEGDCAAFCSVIERWLIRYDRWQSPKYIVSESYGTVRAAVLADMLTGRSSDRLYAISIDGLVFMGNAVGISGLNKNPVYSEVLELPSMAATKWYHDQKKEQSLEDVIAEAYAFAGTEYLTALFAGDTLTSECIQKIAKRLCRFTGLSEEYFCEHHLRVEMNDFLRMLLREKRLDVGLYDGRYTMPVEVSIGTPVPVGDDPSMGKYCPAFTHAMNGEIRKKLGIHFDRTYTGISFQIGARWKYEGGEKTFAQHLSSAMRRNSNTRLFLASGCYDLITVMGAARYVAAHAGLPQDRVWIREYPSGHMPYLGDESASALANDLRTFILGKCEPNSMAAFK